MKRATSFLSFLLLALPLAAATGEQSYVSYDDGEAWILQGSDGREIEARVNLPVFGGDELVTGRAGRSEIRLADGNVIALDRDSVLHLEAVANSYEADYERTVVDLRRGTAIVHLLDNGSALRLDTAVASYVGLTEGIYAVETDPAGTDEISVLSGSVEVRTQERAYRLRAGESARVGSDGLYDIRASSRESSFERWYLNRTERYAKRGRYLDSRYSWVEADLSDHGDWVYIGEFGWVWRPYVVAGWRPYYHGRWYHGRHGRLIWTSYEPWGWYPYHYGRWSFHALYGWVWMPGYTYSPAWVYWTYGHNWLGWTPVGWYDCYRPYRNWYWDTYHTVHHPGREFGVGFFGRVKLSGGDLSGWTFIDTNAVISTRVDRASLTVDQVRERLARGGSDHAIFSSNPIRFGRDDMKDPAAAVGRIVRNGLGGGTGTEGSGSLADLTPFFRRDPELSPDVREKVTRGGLSDAVRRITMPTPAAEPPAAPDPSGARSAGTIVRRGGGSAEPAPTPSRQDSSDRGRIVRPDSSGTTPRVPVTRGSSAPDRGGSGTIRRGDTSPAPESPRREAQPSTPAAPSVPRAIVPRTAPAPDRAESWRGGGGLDRVAVAPRDKPAPRDTGRVERAPDRSDDDWRRINVYRGERDDDDDSGGSRGTVRMPIPRQVIDRIGGARIEPRSSGRSVDRSPSPRRESSRPSISRPSSSSPRSSGRSVSRPSRSSGSSRSVSRPSSSSSSSSPKSSSSSSSSSGSRSGNIKKN
ncbi:MAG: DUF6600 domain-containing protein [Thermoanaerobaculia bacterium]